MTELEKCELAKSKGFTYCPLSGNIRGMKGNVIKARMHGYVYCRILHEGFEYDIKGHRLAWYLHYGKLPVNFIDHKDGVRDNNKIDNLRDVTRQQNNMNTTKAKGVCWKSKAKKYYAQIQLKGKKIYIGYFDNEQDARNAYLAAKEKYHLIPSV